MKSIVLAVMLALAGATFAQQPPADYLKRVADSYRAAFTTASGTQKGYVTREDLVGNNLMLPVFDAIDTNRDGRITADELDAFLANLPPQAA